MNTGSVDTTYARPSAQAAQAFQVFSSSRRGANPLGTLAATRSPNQAPTNGVAPSAATTARIRVPVVDEKSNSPPVSDGSAANDVGTFIPKARSTNLRAPASRPRSSTARAYSASASARNPGSLNSRPDRSSSTPR